MTSSSIDRLSTHLLDTAIGAPAPGIPVLLEQLTADGGPAARGSGVTDSDGRIGQLNADALDSGEYRLTFSTADYFRSVHGAVFYPRIVIHVLLADTRSHFHIPVLASTFSYSTYLGS